MNNYNILQCENAKPIYLWNKYIPPVETEALQQLNNIASLPIIGDHIAVMPDVHLGKGATIGSVIPTVNAIIPAAVGVDIGCGMMACKTDLKAHELPDNLHELRLKIEAVIPHGRTSWNSANDKGAFQEIPFESEVAWKLNLKKSFDELTEKYPTLAKTNNIHHLGTLGTGNHFIEICLDENEYVWVMLHSGSRGVGNAIGQLFIELAKKDMGVHLSNLPDQDLAYLKEGTEHFDDYVKALNWSQRYAELNRYLMMQSCLYILQENIHRNFNYNVEAINCHHNYVEFLDDGLMLTRKGAVSAKKGQYGIIPSNMGNKSYIVKGLGNTDSFCSCSHGAGRLMSRNKAKSLFTCEDQENATQGIECRKDKDVIDEIPMAYKNIDQVMQSQNDLVEIVYTLKQILNIKG